jgi:hypothetical protein
MRRHYMKTKVLLAIILMLCMAGAAYPFTLYMYPYVSGSCASQIIGYSFSYKSFMMPNTGYSGTYTIEEIPDNQTLINAIVANWMCNRYPAGTNNPYVDNEINQILPAPLEGIDSQTQNTKTQHISYGDICPLFCFDATNKLIYRGSDPNLTPYFTP